jgi:lipopolysaccharide/colanic/teichoic acid biosynthesis glycosyltransferase
MSYSIEQLRARTDEELIAEHDGHAVHTVVGTAYYMDELERRSRERATEASNRLAAETQELAKRTYWLTVVTTGLSVIAIVIAVVALFVEQ